MKAHNPQRIDGRRLSQAGAPLESAFRRAGWSTDGRFPTEPPGVLIGGVAVYIRLASVTRPTADADTVARSQAELIDKLVADFTYCSKH